MSLWRVGGRTSGVFEGPEGRQPPPLSEGKAKVPGLGVLPGAWGPGLESARPCLVGCGALGGTRTPRCDAGDPACLCGFGQAPCPLWAFLDDSLGGYGLHQWCLAWGHPLTDEEGTVQGEGGHLRPRRQGVGGRTWTQGSLPAAVPVCASNAGKLRAPQAWARPLRRALHAPQAPSRRRPG